MRLMIAIASLALLCLVGLATEVSAEGPVKIGFLAPLSGAIAQAGKDMYSGCELFWEENGWQLAGRKLYSREFPPLPSLLSASLRSRGGPEYTPA